MGTPDSETALEDSCVESWGILDTFFRSDSMYSMYLYTRIQSDATTIIRITSVDRELRCFSFLSRLYYGQ